MEPENDYAQMEDWYKISWDKVSVYRNVTPPGSEPWSDSFRWSDIERICFEANDFYESDCIYIFLKGQEASVAIPTDASSGADLWGEIIKRKLFDSELAIKAATSGPGLFCDPST
jgi:hypothetical protein